MITIILVGVEHPGNLGAIARAMKNFGCKDLLLIDPKCSPKDQDAKNRAKHANDILENAKKIKISSLKSLDYLIATTATLGTDYNITRSPLTPDQLSKKLPKNTNIGIMFGRESTGLTNTELELADFVVTIPTSKAYPTMNLAQSVAIILYEVSKHDNPIHPQMKKEEKAIIMKEFNRIINSIDFATPEKKKTQQTIWKKLIGKSFLTKREAFAVIGFLKKIK